MSIENKQAWWGGLSGRGLGLTVHSLSKHWGMSLTPCPCDFQSMLKPEKTTFVMPLQQLVQWTALLEQFPHELCFPCATVPFHSITFLSSPEMKTARVQLCAAVRSKQAWHWWRTSTSSLELTVRLSSVMSPFITLTSLVSVQSREEAIYLFLPVSIF